MFLLRTLVVSTVISSGRATVVLLHQGHEGSHAICESLERSCFAFNCHEDFDGGKSGTIDIAGVHSERGVLLRAYKDDMPFFNPDDKFVVLVRTDLMRWSVSMYWKANADRLDSKVVLENGDPQFALREGGNPQLAAKAGHMQMDLLDIAARRNINTWYQKRHVLNYLRENNMTYVVITYEQYVMDGDALLKAAMSAIGEKRDDALDCAHDVASMLQPMTRVHTEDLYDYTTNADEVLNHFTTQNYTTWGQCCGQFHADRHVSATHAWRSYTYGAYGARRRARRRRP
mmetsp:Transcript_2994/g.9332  ORF Transcript_2994/g.9332 Transcript_2994/m.9332 type:complete len:287 (+) Transcript_2994:106-966(+)